MDEKPIKTAPSRPLCLSLADAERRIYSVINDLAQNQRIPFYLLEGIVNEAARDVKANAEIERTKAAELYQQQLKEFKESKETKDEGTDEA